MSYKYSTKLKLSHNTIPTTDQLLGEIKRLNRRKSIRHIINSTFSSLLVVGAIAVLISVMFLPVLRVTGTSMTPNLNNEELVVCKKTGTFKQGDIIAFYHNNKILLKRVIGVSGDIIDIDSDGNVSVNGTLLDEPYITDKALGECDIEFPYQVPDKRVFVLGDHRSTSIDSRSSQIGCVNEESIIGKVFLKIYPLDEMEFI